MASKVLYYALRKADWSDGEIVGVTTEKPNQYYGRTEPYKTPTHGSKRDLVGRFDTVDKARAAQTTIREIRLKHAPLIKAAASALNRAHHAERSEIKVFTDALD